MTRRTQGKLDTDALFQQVRGYRLRGGRLAGNGRWKDALAAYDKALDLWTAAGALATKENILVLLEFALILNAKAMAYSGQSHARSGDLDGSCGWATPVADAQGAILQTFGPHVDLLCLLSDLVRDLADLELVKKAKGATP